MDNLKQKPFEIDELSLRPQTTLKIQKRIENLHLQDLNFDADDDVVVGPPSFDPDEKLYNNLISLDVSKTKVPQMKSSRQAMQKDRPPDYNDFINHLPLTQYAFRPMMMRPDFPQEAIMQDSSHDLYKKVKTWGRQPSS